MNKYVFYFRVSTKKQGESGLGLNAQRTYIEHFYSGKEILGEFTENVSGKDIISRPGLQKAIALCKKEKATLVVAKIDRLSKFNQAFKQMAVELSNAKGSVKVAAKD